VYENRVLRRIFGRKRDEVTGEWRKLYNKELTDLMSSPNIIQVIKLRRMRWAGHVAQMERRGAYRVLVGKLEAKRPFGRPRHRWEVYINLYLTAHRVWCGHLMSPPYESTQYGAQRPFKCAVQLRIDT
jgi:hypothetical protein